MCVKVWEVLMLTTVKCLAIRMSSVKFPMHPSTYGGGPFLAWNLGAHLIKKRR
jgi:hypothetical protein